MPATEYHAQLLGLARELVAGRPNRAKLHRAVSSAYYALFHLLIKEGTKVLSVDPGVRAVAARAFDHGAMKDVADQVKSGNLPKRLQGLPLGPVPPELKRVAEVFSALQGLRHDADYNPDRTPRFTRNEVERHVRDAEDAVEKWRQVAGQPVAKAFLLALLLNRRWDR